MELQLTEVALGPAAALPAESFPDTVDRLDVWLISPERSYARWLETVPNLSTGSRTVYCSMWTKFVRWLDRRGVGLDLCSADHISAFLDENHLEREHRQRYVRLIFRAYAHLDRLGLSIRNPGQEAKLKGVGMGENEPTKFLTVAERDRLYGVLRRIIGASGAGGGRPRSETNQVEWVKVRDAAIACLMVGGGLKVGEVARLAVSCTLDGDLLPVPDQSQVGFHLAQLFPIAREGFETWRAVRRELPFESDRLFPAALEHRPGARRLKSDAMHPVTIFRRLSQLLHEAEISGARASGQILRNTYAGMLIDAGASAGVLRTSLGMVGELSVPRLQAQYAAWKKALGAKVDSGRHCGVVSRSDD